MIEIQEHSILLEMKSRSKDGALEELGLVLAEQHRHLDFDALLHLLREREQIGSTGVGNGVAIPHARVSGLESVLLCFGRSQEGISYDAIDNQPVHLLVIILSPADRPDEYLQTLGRVSRFLKKQETRRRLRLAQTPKEIVSIFLEDE